VLCSPGHRDAKRWTRSLWIQKIYANYCKKNYFTVSAHSWKQQRRYHYHIAKFSLESSFWYNISQGLTCGGICNVYCKLTCTAECAAGAVFEHLSTFLPRDATQSAVMRLLSSVRPSVCPSVTFRYRVQIRWNSSKIISRPNSLRPICSLTPNIGDLVQREHPQN